MPAKPAPVNRPVPVTALCSILFAAGLFNIAYSFTGIYAPYGIWYSAVNALLTVIIFAALSGVWSMEKWGLWLFSGAIAAKIGIDVFAGALSLADGLLLLPVAVFLFYRKQMS